MCSGVLFVVGGVRFVRGRGLAGIFRELFVDLISDFVVIGCCVSASAQEFGPSKPNNPPAENPVSARARALLNAIEFFVCGVWCAVCLWSGLWFAVCGLFVVEFLSGSSATCLRTHFCDVFVGVNCVFVAAVSGRILSAACGLRFICGRVLVLEFLFCNV